VLIYSARKGDLIINKTICIYTEDWHIHTHILFCSTFYLTSRLAAFNMNLEYLHWSNPDINLTSIQVLSLPGSKINVIFFKTKQE
jgi:hypothetical protein